MSAAAPHWHEPALHALSANAMASGFAAGRFTPSDVWDAWLQAVDSDAYGCFVCVDAEGARAQADASTRRWRQGRAWGPLDGVPVSIKDLVMQQGLPTRRGSVLGSSAAASQDAPVVQRLRAAGAVLVGKTSTTEMGTGIHGDSCAHGRTLHPLNAARSIGGSSCGAAAQLAAGWGPLAIGSDAGGSVRIPASYAGLTAFKPTFANIPMWPVSPFMEWAHLGPMARNVADLKTIMAVIGHADVRDPGSLYPRSENVALQRPLRIGVCSRMGTSWLQPAIADALQALPAQLRSFQWARHPVQVSEVDFSHIDTGASMWVLWCSRVLEAGLDLSEQDVQQWGPDMRQQWRQGAAQTVDALARARQCLRLAAAQLTQAFAQLDVLLTPSTPSTAPMAGEFVAEQNPQAHALRLSGNWMDATPFSHPWNLTQQPALSLPWGHDESGMPFGLQVVGARYSDGLVLDVSKALEAWHKEHAQ